MHCLKTMQILLLWAVVAVQSYPSNPHRSNPYKSETQSKRDYSFSYEVEDKYVGLEFNQDEKSEQGLVMGNYAVQLPDGRKQIVKYQADHDIGFLADVIYEGQASYPSGGAYDDIKGGYVPNKESYIPPKRYTTTKDKHIPKKQSYIPNKESYSPPKRYTITKDTHIPKKQSYIPNKETYSPPKRYTITKDTHIPKKQSYIPNKESYSPPKRYTTTKATHIPKQESYIPKKDSNIPKKQIYTPQTFRSRPQDPYSYKPVELSQPISFNQPNLNPTGVGNRKVIPSQDSYEPEPSKEFEMDEDPLTYPLPLDMEIPDEYKDILTSDHQRNINTPESISEQYIDGAIPETYFPLPYEEFPEPFLPPHPRFTDEGISDAKSISSDVQPEPLPAEIKVARTEIQSGPISKETKEIQPRKKTELPLPESVKNIYPERRSDSIQETHKGNPETDNVIQRKLKTNRLSEEEKVVRSEDISESLLAEGRIISDEDTAEQLLASEENINSKPTPKLPKEEAKDTGSKPKTEPLPVAAKIISNKVQSLSIDKPQYVKKPGLFKRENKKA